MVAGTPPRFRDSAAIVLVRGHGRGLEVFWVRRSDAVSVQPGFWAFIGGKLDAQDASLPLAGVEDAAERAARACAIREALEETGVLVAVEGAVDAAALAAARAELLAGHATLAALAERHGWRLRADLLTPAGRWQTPAFAAVRFDTLFYLARVPPGQEPRIEPGELAVGEWVRPHAALARYHRGEAVFAAPILWTLLALAEGEERLAERIAQGPERSRTPVKRIELAWGVVLHAMRTRPLPPAQHTNAYFVGERELALVDPGSGEPDELAALFAVADHLADEGRRVKYVVATHHHADHTGGVAACRERFGARVAGSAALAEHLPLDLTLGDGDVLPLSPGEGTWDLRAFLTPGHTRDSLCLWHERTRSLFCGDLLAGGAGTVVVDPPDGDMRAYLASLERVALLEPRTLYPAHGSPQGAAVRRIRGLIAHRREREGRVLAALAPGPRTLEELVPVVYADTPQELWGWAARSLLAHLELLEAGGRAVREGDRWRSA